MKLQNYFPIWDKLTPAQRETLTDSAVSRAVKKGAVLHSGSMDCAGLLLVRQGQLRAYILSDEGREITLYRLFDRDICLFSASCMMRSIQFEIVIEAEKDTELWVIPAHIYQGITEESAPAANFTNELMATRFSEVMWLMEQVMWRSFDKRLGTAREVVTRMLRYFQREGMVKLARGTVDLTDIEKLKQLQNA